MATNTSNNKLGLEIERRFLIKKPSIAAITAIGGSTVSEILQTYIESAPGTVSRVRERRYSDRTDYVQTTKTKVSKMSAIEEEREISLSEYKELLLLKKQGTETVAKTRYTFPYLERTVEIDIYPQWSGVAVMEVELPAVDTPLVLPPFIEVIREITGVKEYSNHSLAHGFPPEPV